jgi:hypothetical protein
LLINGSASNSIAAADISDDKTKDETKSFFHEKRANTFKILVSYLAEE